MSLAGGGCVLVEEQRPERATETPRTVTLRGREYPVVLPRRSDPRLQLAVVITTLHVLGQTAFDFDLSITQIVASILTCAVLEFVITFSAKQVIAWPASAMLTGNGVAFILRVPGTQHGDWWSTRGLWIFVATAAVSLLSKYVIRFRGRHVFNPSNFGLLVCFLVLGSKRAEPLDFWWARMSPALAFAYVVILVGGLTIVRRTRMVGAAFAFWATFAAAIGVVAAAGHCMTARWHIGPVCDGYFWFILVTSPEILVFLFFMITDPKTAPLGGRARTMFGAAIAVVAALLIAPQRTEYATKVAVLGALAVACAARPLFERVTTARPATGRASRRAAVIAAAACTVVLVAAGDNARPAGFAEHADAPARAPVLHDTVDISRVRFVAIGSTKEFATALTQEDANEIAHDFVDDLEITANALQRRDTELAATGGDEKWLARVQRTIEQAPASQVDVPAYAFDSMTVAVLKLRARQAAPEIDVRVTGTRRSSRDAPAEPFRRVYVVEKRGDHYVITDDRAR